MSRRIALDQLPSLHGVARALLSGEALTRRKKNAAEVLREYDVEKWGKLLQELKGRGDGYGFSAVDQAALAGTEDCVSVRGDRLYLEKHVSALKRFRRLIGAELRNLMPASALVELGAGYGGVFFPALKHVTGTPPQLLLLALEYTPSGRELISRIADAERLPVTVGSCDLGAQNISEAHIPAGALIFTCFAIPYVPVLSMSLIRSLCAWRPKAVVHFEPLVHPECQCTVLGILRRRYLEINDYNQNFLEVLQVAEKERVINIAKLEANWFGVNALLPASLVIWSPAMPEAEALA